MPISQERRTFNVELFLSPVTRRLAAALGRRPGTPQAGTPSGARDRQSDGGATAGPMQHLAELRGVQAGARRQQGWPEEWVMPECPKK